MENVLDNFLGKNLRADVGGILNKYGDGLDLLEDFQFTVPRDGTPDKEWKVIEDGFIKRYEDITSSFFERSITPDSPIIGPFSNRRIYLPPFHKSQK